MLPSDDLDGAASEIGDLDGLDHDVTGAASGSAARIVSIAVGVFVVALVALLALGGGTDDDDLSSDVLGVRVPLVAGEAVDGRDYDIDDERGRWVLVNFFGTWCGPCVEEHPELVALEGWGEQNDRLRLVSVAFNERPDRVQAFFDERGGSWPVLDDAEVSVEFGISRIPESFLVAPSGLVVQHLVGGITADDVTATILANDLPVSQGGVGPEPGG